MIKAPQMANFARKFSSAYNRQLAPLCEMLDMPQTAVDILMFLDNNPGFNTARDICRFRTLKPGIVSFHIDHMVREGLLERHISPTDRRVYRLVCTEKAAPIIESGRRLQLQFAQQITDGLCEEQLQTFRLCLETIDTNLDVLLKEDPTTKSEVTEC